MDFFKSVFSDPTPSPPTTPNSPTTPPSWGFGSALLKTIASKSESLLDNYYKDLQEFSSGLKKETSVIRQAASRAVQELPARLESGAAIAQESLEAVGQAIDNVGSTVSEIIGKDLNFSSTDGYLNGSDDNSGNSDKDLSFTENAKPYSRIEAIIRALQCSIRTYCDEVEGGYDDWKVGFRLEEKRDEIERLIEENGVIKEIFDEVVPVKVDEETFWCRYFYRVNKLVKAEEARASMVKRAISREVEEELSWDVDDDDDGDDQGKDKHKKDVDKKGKGVEDSGDNEGASVSGTKSDHVVDDESLGVRLVDNEKEVLEEKIGSDISIISSQRSSHVDDDLGWDEIEAIRSSDESNVGDQGLPSPIGASDLRKRLSASEEDEELTWDIEEDGDEPVKK